MMRAPAEISKIEREKKGVYQNELARNTREKLKQKVGNLSTGSGKNNQSCFNISSCE